MRKLSSFVLIGDNLDMKFEIIGEGREIRFRIYVLVFFECFRLKK